MADKAVQFVTQPYASDIDHTGGLSEAIITLPQAVAPHGTVELEIAYEGVIVLDATRLTRIGAPEDAARSTDWDQIDADFTALRGAGYVAWYPIATEVANLSEGNSLFEVLATMEEPGSCIEHASEDWAIEGWHPDALDRYCLVESVIRCPELHEAMATEPDVCANCTYQPLRLDSPALIIAEYQVLERLAIEVQYLRGHGAAATSFADAAEKTAPFIAEWFGTPREKAKTADLPNPGRCAIRERSALADYPLAERDSKLAGLAAAHQLTHASFLSFRPWIKKAWPTSRRRSISNARKGVRSHSITWGCIALR